VAELFDTHAHLTDERFADDIDDVLARMAAAPVTRAVLVCDGTEDPAAAFALAGAHENFHVAVGVHPHDASKYDEAFLSAALRREKVVALGEIGLDYHYDLSPRGAQRDVFDAQLALAYERGLPVILHVREAHGDATELLTARHRAGRLGAGVMHCYTGSVESAKTYLDMGLYISLSGAVTFKNAPKLQEVARFVPGDRLLVETDCPYMSPVPMRGQRNEPAFVRYTAEAVAALRGESFDEFARRATENGKRLFAVR
jgi:TatD DNase family protein